MATPDVVAAVLDISCQKESEKSLPAYKTNVTSHSAVRTLESEDAAYKRISHAAGSVYVMRPLPDPASICCFFDGEPLEAGWTPVPLPAPLELPKDVASGKCKIRDVFVCSINCGVAQLLQEAPTSVDSNAMATFDCLMKHLFKVGVANVQPTPPRECHAKYRTEGGLTTAEMRAVCQAFHVKALQSEFLTYPVCLQLEAVPTVVDGGAVPQKAKVPPLEIIGEGEFTKFLLETEDVSDDDLF